MEVCPVQNESLYFAQNYENLNPSFSNEVLIETCLNY